MTTINARIIGRGATVTELAEKLTPTLLPRIQKLDNVGSVIELLNRVEDRPEMYAPWWGKGMTENVTRLKMILISQYIPSMEVK